MLVPVRERYLTQGAIPPARTGELLSIPPGQNVIERIQHPVKDTFVYTYSNINLYSTVYFLICKYVQESTGECIRTYRSTDV